MKANILLVKHSGFSTRRKNCHSFKTNWFPSDKDMMILITMFLTIVILHTSFGAVDISDLLCGL